MGQRQEEGGHHREDDETRLAGMPATAKHNTHPRLLIRWSA
jgi:hypothetical protein